MPTVLVVFLVIVLVLQLIMLAVLSSFGFTLFTGSPYVPTHPVRARRMLEFVDLKEGETILDLGSGNGAILFCAAEEFGARQAIGYEINPVLVWWSRLRAVVRRATKRVQTQRKNIFSVTLPQVDVVAIFLIPQTMEKLREKLARELAPETRIISRGFTFPKVEPRKKLENDTGWYYLYFAGDL